MAMTNGGLTLDPLHGFGFEVRGHFLDGVTEGGAGHVVPMF